MLEQKGTTDLKWMIIVLIASGCGVLCYDIWQVATGHVDPNKHLPLFVPLVLAAFAAIVWRIKRHCEGLTPEQKNGVLKRAHEDSFLNPKHHPREREL